MRAAAAAFEVQESLQLGCGPSGDQCVHDVVPDLATIRCASWAWAGVLIALQVARSVCSCSARNDAARTSHRASGVV